MSFYRTTNNVKALKRIIIILILLVGQNQLRGVATYGGGQLHGYVSLDCTLLA